MWFIAISILVTVGGNPGGEFRGDYEQRFKTEVECMELMRSAAFQDETKEFIRHVLTTSKLPDGAQVKADIKCVSNEVKA